MLAYLGTWILLYAPAAFSPALWGSTKLLLIALLSSAAIALQPSYKPEEATVADRGTARIFAAGLLPFYVLTVLEARWRGAEAAAAWDLASGLTLVIALLGLGIRTWAVRTLGRFFTLHVKATRDQPVITDGPYRFVRHPAYTGAILMLLATPAMLGSWWTFAAAAVLFPAWFATRIRQEEAVLLAALGANYAKYRETTPALIPSVRRAVFA